MSDPARVRLVRCPNCQNLLPELAANSVYRCGGCGTVLKAKTGGFAESEKSFDGSDWDDTSSHKSGKQKINFENDSNKHVRESRRTRKSSDWRMEKQQDEEIFRRNQNLGVDHQIRSDYDDDRYKNEYKEQNPSELLRKLDELKHEIRRSYQLQEKAKENVPYMQMNHGNVHNPSCSCFHCHEKRLQIRHNETFEYNRQSKVMLPASGRRCLPIAGGLPFVICYNCSKLLQVPRKVLFLENKRKKMQCGSCLTILLLEVVEKKLVISSCEEQSHIMNEGSSQFNLSSDDNYDHIQYTNGKPNSSSRVLSSDHVEKIPIQIKPPPPPKGSSLQDYFEYSNIYRAIDKVDDGNERGQSEEASFATEIDVSFDYTNSGTSQESGYTRSREGRSRTSSLFSGFKKSVRDFSKSSHGSDQEAINVVVNGHAITDRLVKKAEKLAGPIQPGNYWYDFRAGFWGVMGGPCLGIIPPFIEELNHPLRGDCAGGETAVFVNGRELHPKDFNLLCSRGLPRETNRSYIIEMSGRVLDEISGEELEPLGSLAPSVLKTKRGFGMKPRIVAA